MPRELPIFPLPLVLFPGVPLPLHIFEPRYRQLVTDVLAADGRLGIVSSPPGAASEARPRAGQTGCIALIRTTQALPDGRSNIFTTGERRFVLDRWMETDRLYEIAIVSEFDDDAGDEPADTQRLAAAVRRGYERLRTALGTLLDREPDLAELPNDPSTLSFRVAAALDLDLAMKQALLESRSARARLHRLDGILTSLATEAEQRAAIHRRGRGNGKGGFHPRIEPRQ